MLYFSKWKFFFKHLLSVIACGNPYRHDWAWKRLKKFSNPILTASISTGFILMSMKVTREINQEKSG